MTDPIVGVYGQTARLERENKVLADEYTLMVERWWVQAGFNVLQFALWAIWTA